MAPSNRPPCVTGRRPRKTRRRPSPAPWCGGGRRLGAPASRHAKRNPKDNDSRDVRAFLDRAAAAGASRGRRCGHRRRRHHRRNRGSHPGRGRRVLALGRRPLHQERARPDPPAAGDRPRQRDVGARARRARRGPCRAHPDRDPADADALHPGRSQPARDATDAGRAWPSLAGPQAHRGHRQAPPPAGAGGGEGSQGRARRGAGTGAGTAQEGPFARGRRRHPRGRRGEAPPAWAGRLIGAGRPVESFGIPLNPT